MGKNLKEKFAKWDVFDEQMLSWNCSHCGEYNETELPELQVQCNQCLEMSNIPQEALDKLWEARVPQVEKNE